MSAKDPPRIKWLVAPTYDDDGVQRTAGLDHLGREHPDPCPVAPPVGLSVGSGEDPTYKAIQRLLVQHRREFGLAVDEEGFESEEEANDFLCPDDLFPPGNEPWEDIFLFPVPEEGRSATLASSAPNGENRAPEDATRQPSTSSEGLAKPGPGSRSVRQTSSVGSAFVSKEERSAEKPTPSSDSLLHDEQELRERGSARPAPGK